MQTCSQTGGHMQSKPIGTDTSADSSRLHAGAKRFEDVMGASASAFIDHFKGVAPDFGKYILEWEFGDLYGRPNLDLRTRELVIIASCATLGSAGLGAVKMHIGAALRAGASRAEIAEVLMQLGFSAGLPTAIAALDAAREAFAAIDAASAEQA
ncbi:carboxymuconolactone decarboxylase family protein (plasmid) [Burkholderia sp. M6-3]